MRQVVRGALVLAPLLWACYSYELDGLALVTPLNSIVVGDTLSLSVVTLTGTVRPATDVSWRSSDETIATIDRGGVVRGTGPGTVVLQARTADYDLEVALLVLEVAGPFVSLGSGADHSCALTGEGAVWCWGRNPFGQLGISLPPDQCPLPGGGALLCAAGAIPVAGASFGDLAVGADHNCGLDQVGAASCWGSNEWGQLGDGGTASGPTPLPVVGGHRFRSLTAGERRTCGIRLDDALMCWGGGPLRVGGVTIDTLTGPAHVADEHTFSVVATTSRHICGVTTDGSTYCWGDNEAGQLGVETVDSICGSIPCTLEPQRVESAPVFVDLALGDGFSCGLTTEGAAHCWGGNGEGQLGDGTLVGRWEAQPVAGGHTFERLEAGPTYACGVDTGGGLLCWGRAGVGIGGGNDAIEVDRPTLGAPGLDLTETAIGFDSQCGLTVAGIAWCWGGNLDGAVGNGRPAFTTVVTPERVVRHPDYSSRILGSK